MWRVNVEFLAATGGIPLVRRRNLVPAPPLTVYHVLSEEALGAIFYLRRDESTPTGQSWMALDGSLTFFDLQLI